MRRPPWPVVAIAIFDLIGAATSFGAVDIVGITAAVLQFLFFVALALGLLALKNWARLAELAVNSVQIVGAAIAIAFPFLAPTILGTAVHAPKLEFLFQMGMLIVISIAVIVVLRIPRIRALFR